MPEPIKASFNQPFYRAVEELKKRGVVLPDKYYGELQGLHRQLNFSIAGKASLDQLQAVLNSLEDVLNKGGTFEKWQKDIRVQDLGLPKHRLDNIFRTNIQAAYNRGHWEKFVQHEKSRPYLMYDAINDSRVRPSHLAMDGIIRPVGDNFWATNYPPNGFRCRCRCISLTEKQARERSKNGAGLNQAVTDEMEPDKGWDYHVGQDLMAGVNQAIKESKAHPVLKSQVEKTLANEIMKIKEAEIAENLLQNLITNTQAITGKNKLSELFISEKNYHKHVAKRLKNDEIISEIDYQEKTFATLSDAEKITIAIPSSSDMISGKIQVFVDSWVVLLSLDGKVITSYPFDEDKQTFEQNEINAGSEIYEHSISEQTRKILKRVFGLS